MRLVRGGSLALTLALAAGSAGAARAETVAVRWLGVAGFSIQAGDTVILHDPYFSRPGRMEAAFSRYEPDAEVLERLFSAESGAPELASARLVLIGHSHFDHVGDAPWIARRLGARIAGSETTLNIGRGYGVDEARLLRVDPGDRFVEGPFEIRVVESRHARVLFGRVPLEGALTEPPEAPIHVLSFPLGDARSYLITHRESGLRILVNSSADRHGPALDALRSEGVEVDLLLAATQGRDDAYALDLVEATRPRLVVPHHHDDFFEPLGSETAGDPSDPEDLARFEREVRDAAAASGLESQVRRLALFERILLPPDRKAGMAPAQP